MGKFWVEDIFIDKYAKRLSFKAFSVYICLKRHARGKLGRTHTASRPIAKELGINLSTAQSGLRELIDKKFISKRIGKNATGYYTVYPLTEDMSHPPNQNTTTSDLNHKSSPTEEISQKEVRNNIKEDKMYYNNKPRTDEEQKIINERLSKMRKTKDEKGMSELKNK